MYESSVIQHFTEQGIKQEQGERKGAIESLLDVLERALSIQRSADLETYN